MTLESICGDVFILVENEIEIDQGHFRKDYNIKIMNAFPIMMKKIFT